MSLLFIDLISCYIYDFIYMNVFFFKLFNYLFKQPLLIKYINIYIIMHAFLLRKEKVNLLIKIKLK